jgi:hypothetical protein
VVEGKVDISNLDHIPNQPTICKMPDLSGRSYDNARFIVLAVNSHDELLEKLRELTHLTGIMNNEQHAGIKNTPEEWSRLYAITNTAKAIIAEIEAVGEKR